MLKEEELSTGTHYRQARKDVGSNSVEFQGVYVIEEVIWMQQRAGFGTSTWGEYLKIRRVDPGTGIPPRVFILKSDFLQQFDEA